MDAGRSRHRRGSRRPARSETGLGAAEQRTFLFTDIEGSSRRWEHLPGEMDAALTFHDSLVTDVVAAHGGRIFKHTGDGVAVVFEEPMDAVLCAVTLQRRLAEEGFEEVGGLRVRAGIHLGEAVTRGDDWFGPALNRCARLMGMASGGQVLVSEEVARRLGPVAGHEVHLRDLGEHVLRDLVGSERVHQVEATGLPSDFPPLASLTAYRTNLRAQLTSFVGRHNERRRLRELIGPGALVTITGIGGGGKTRLALQTAGELLDEYRDGVFVVEFASVADTWAVPRTVATTVGCFDPLVETIAGGPEQAAVATTEYLASALASRSLLLVLDNCEHLVEAIREFVRLVAPNCPDVAILATSREPLGVPGETRFEIPPLRVEAIEPGSGQSLEDDGAAAEAVTLFRDRARAVRPDFELTDANLHAVLQICRRVDGIPLAVELAAAKVAVLTPAQIADRLDDALAILQDGTGRDRRHATLESALLWSYEQLESYEQRALCRLAVFRGGCTLEAAEAVAGHAPLEPTQVLPVIEGLATKSLVRVDTTGEHARYHLLEPVRQFAEARLGGWGDDRPVREAHARWVVERFRDARMLANLTHEFITALHTEEGNLRAAFEWGCHHDDEITVRLAGYAFWFLRARAEHTTAAAWAQEAIDRLGTTPSPHLAGAMGMLAGVMETIGDTVRAVELLEQTLRINEQLDYPRGTGWSAAMLGRVYALAGRHDEAVGQFSFADEQLQLASDGAGRSWCAVNEAWISLWNGDHDHTRRRIDDILATDGAAADPVAMAHVLEGVLELLDGDTDTGARWIDEGLAAIVSTTDRAYALPFIARYELGTSRHAEGVRHLRDGIALLRETGQVSMMQFALEAAACINPQDPEAAARLFGAADHLYEQLGTAHPGPAGASVEHARAEVRQRLGDGPYQRLHDAGRQLPVIQAVDLALEQLAQP